MYNACIWTTPKELETRVQKAIKSRLGDEMMLAKSWPWKLKGKKEILYFKQ